MLLSSGWRVSGFCSVMALCLCSNLLAQSSETNQKSADKRFTFFPNYSYHLNFQRLVTDDIRFNWQGNFGGEAGLIDYGFGQLTFLANFEVVLGEELRAFDPNQENYILDLSASVRRRFGELALVFHHNSRHLSDRSKTIPIDWNMVGVQFFRPLAVGDLQLETRSHAYFTTQRSYVDYRAELGGSLTGLYYRGDRVAIVTKGELVVRPVDPDIFQRDTQFGSRVELGIRLGGVDGIVEFFVSRERRIDAVPFKLTAQHWTSFGFRLLGGHNF